MYCCCHVESTRQCYQEVTISAPFWESISKVWWFFYLPATHYVFPPATLQARRRVKERRSSVIKGGTECFFPFGYLCRTKMIDCKGHPSYLLSPHPLLTDMSTCNGAHEKVRSLLLYFLTPRSCIQYAPTHCKPAGYLVSPDPIAAGGRRARSRFALLFVAHSIFFFFL